MANFEPIEAALQIAFGDRYDSEMPIEYELAPPITERKRNASMWMKLINLPARSSVATLGDKGTDNNPGIYQVDLNVRPGGGKAAILLKADEIATAFPAGTVLQFGGVSVTITGVSISPVREVTGWARVSLSFSYYARTARRP